MENNMTIFNYKIELSCGRTEIGEIEAESYDEAKEILHDMFITIEEDDEKNEYQKDLEETDDFYRLHKHEL
jgi:type II secretory pathway component PulF